MTLSEYCASLSQKKLFELAIVCCEKALPIWNEFSSKNELSYTDTVVALHHNVRPELLNDSLAFCKKGTLGELVKENRLNDLLIEFGDPIIALQDLDWELPPNVQLVFLSVYNLLDGLKKPDTLFNEQTHYVSVNKAVDALYSTGAMTVDQIKDLIYNR